MFTPAPGTWTAPSPLPPLPPRRRNLWAIGGVVVAVVAVVLAAVLGIVRQVNDPAGGPGGDGDVLADETCEQFDLGAYEALYGTGPDSAEADGYGSGGVGNLTCAWSHSGADGGGLAVDAWTDADSAVQYWLDEKSWWTEHADTVADFGGAGESGFLYVQGAEGEPQKRQITFVTGRLTVSVFCWIDAQQSPADADAFLEDLAAQAETIAAPIA